MTSELSRPLVAARASGSASKRGDRRRADTARRRGRRKRTMPRWTCCSSRTSWRRATPVAKRPLGRHSRITSSRISASAVAEQRRDVAGRELLGDAEHQTADDGADEGAHAADRDRDEAEDREELAGVELQRRDRRDDDAADARRSSPPGRSSTASCAARRCPSAAPPSGSRRRREAPCPASCARAGTRAPR